MTTKQTVSNEELLNRHLIKCRECGRVFDLLDEVDSEEWYYGHDCEVEWKILQVRADSVGWGDDPEKVIEQYLPRGYRVTGTVDGFVQIEGEDFAGWTAQDYVIPRLASGMIYATVVES